MGELDTRFPYKPRIRPHNKGYGRPRAMGDSRSRTRTLRHTPLNPRGSSMSAPVTCDEFLDLVRRSAVLEDERLDKFASALSDSGTALEQPKALAERMI